MKVRVHQLAKELGTDSRRLMANLARQGVVVRSASSVLDDRTVAGYRARGSTAALATRSGDTSLPMPASVQAPHWWDEDWRDPEEQLSATRAARELGVSAATIRQWVRRGYLVANGKSGRAHLYRRADLERARDKARANTPRPPAPFMIPRHLTQRPVTTAQAARIGGVAESTIRMWVHRGHLHPMPTETRSHLFDPIQVLRIARRR